VRGAASLARPLKATSEQRERVFHRHRWAAFDRWPNRPGGFRQQQDAELTDSGYTLCDPEAATGDMPSRPVPGSITWIGRTRTESK